MPDFVRRFLSVIPKFLRRMGCTAMKSEGDWRKIDHKGVQERFREDINAIWREKWQRNNIMQTV